MEQTRRDIEAETRRAIQEIRNEVADLTVLATEKVTRKTLDEDDQRRLVEEALAELDFSALAGGSGTVAMEEIAQVYARSLFEVAKEQDKLDDVREQLGQFADALRRGPRAAEFFFSPVLLDRGEEGRAAQGGRRRRADLMNFLELLDREAPDAGDLPHPARLRRAVGEENKILPVQITTRHRARRRDRQGDRRPHRRADRTARSS